ncbi:MAG: 16S rRNA (uracil(1498)-N(3))-methyltransferase [Planctomycetaceae bacterium]|nr:16S rRNA (uracil(1498)-N(3))-methyltransferase [Planctomycetaceae bacterium]
MPDRFFSEVPLRPQQLVTLDPQQSHHLLHVLRAELGDEVHLFDGGPDEYLARVVSKDRRSIRLEVVSRIERPAEKSTELLVAAAVPKGDRFRTLIEKLTELGVTAFLPVQSTRTVNPFSTSLRQKAEQWVIEACKQSRRNSLLEILPPMTPDELLFATRHISERYVACAPVDLQVLLGSENSEPSNPPKLDAGDAAGDTILATCRRALLVGPEGGFTTDEVRLVCNAGWRSLSLGQHVLRIETAAMAGAALLVQAEHLPR